VISVNCWKPRLKVYTHVASSRSFFGLSVAKSTEACDSGQCLGSDLRRALDLHRGARVGTSPPPGRLRVESLEENETEKKEADVFASYF